MCITDLYTVKSDVLSISHTWKSFGLALGIGSDVLKRIECEHKGTDVCLEAALTEWLKNGSNQSWEQLVKAVGAPAGGNNRALAMKIATKYHGTRLFSIEKICNFISLSQYSCSNQ